MKRAYFLRWPQGAAAVPALLAASLIGAAGAQTPSTTEAARIVATDTQIVIAPMRADQPSGVATKQEAGAVDWDQVRDTLRDARIREGAYERQMRAMSLSRKIGEEEREAMRPKGVRAAAAESFKQVAAEEVRQTRVPMLIPMTNETMGEARVFARENSYAVVVPLPGGASYEFLGTRMRVVGGNEETRKMRMSERSAAMRQLAATGAPYVISRHEQGIDLSFSKFNVAYLISVSCPDPVADARCAGDEFVLSLANDLGLLNEPQGETP